MRGKTIFPNLLFYSEVDSLASETTRARTSGEVLHVHPLKTTPVSTLA